jgi:predicted nucleotide-binding protein (sugar kinase/HSP70/actin superfamily)
VTEDESDFASVQGMKAMDIVDADLQNKGKAILETVEAENRVAVLMIGRPYHSDPGLNHGVLEEFQVLGYPILSMRSIPKDPVWLHRFFESDIKAGASRHRWRCRTCGRELLDQLGAEGVGGQVRRAPPERRRAGPVVVQVRSRRALA